MRKQFELILTASLPVVVLIVGFFAVTSQATLRWYETANPSEAGAYYRDGEENDEGISFGPEVNSGNLCGPLTNDFDITSTYESASISASSTPNKVSWYRFQDWRFNSSNTPWGTDNVNITLSYDYDWDGEELANGGFPWSGWEDHWREHNEEGMVVPSRGHVTTYKTTFFNNSKFMCPDYVKIVTEGFFVRCSDLGTDWIGYYNTDDHDKFHPAATHPYYPTELSRWDEKTNTHHFCIKLN